MWMNRPEGEIRKQIANKCKTKIHLFNSQIEAALASI